MPNSTPTDSNNKRSKYQHQVILTSDRVNV